jgi:hypothetical protein
MLSIVATMNKHSRAALQKAKMSDIQEVNTKKVDSLRADLKDLRERARETGVLKPAGTVSRRTRRSAAETVEATEKGKAAAARIRAMLQRGENDESAIIAGTNFTEDGVRRVIELLIAPRKQPVKSQRIFEWLHRFLTSPVQDGEQMVAGVSAVKVRRLSRLLQQIETHGWEQFRSRRAERLGTVSGNETPSAPQPVAAATVSTRKRQHRRVSA